MSRLRNIQTQNTWIYSKDMGFFMDSDDGGMEEMLWQYGGNGY